MRRAEFERWSTVIGGFAVAGAFYHYVLFAIGARTANGKFEASILDVVHRTEEAPAQCRIFVPGRINEVRLFFPVTFALILVGTELWQAMIQSLDREPVRVE